MDLTTYRAIHWHRPAINGVVALVCLSSAPTYRATSTLRVTTAARGSPTCSHIISLARRFPTAVNPITAALGMYDQEGKPVAEFALPKKESSCSITNTSPNNTYHHVANALPPLCQAASVILPSSIRGSSSSAAATCSMGSTIAAATYLPTYSNMSTRLTPLPTRIFPAAGNRSCCIICGMAFAICLGEASRSQSETATVKSLCANSFCPIPSIWWRRISGVISG